MKRLFMICGEAGTGKDTILRKVVSSAPAHFNEIVSYTTRPPREGEIDGINYHFVTGDKFAEMVVNGEMIEASVFNDWCYGTAKSTMVDDKINIGVFNPEGIYSILESSFSEDSEITPFRVVASDKQRLIRQLNREQYPDINEIIRRYSTDNNDFLDLDFYYIPLVNETEKDIQDAVDRILREANI